jgi:hypothetical protein
VGRVTIRIRPRLLARGQLARIGKCLGRDQPFQRRKPMLVIMGAVVGFPAFRSGLELLGQSSGPFFPSEVTLFGQADGQSEGLRLPGLGKYGTPVVARKRG